LEDTAVYLENLLKSIPSGVIAVSKQGEIALFNSAAETITGFRSRDAVGASYSSILGGGVPLGLTPLHTLATGCPIDREEKMLTTQSGDRVPVSFSTSLVMNADGRIAGAIEVITDLRKIKLLEEEVSRAKTLATVGEMAAVVAHEIRNPLGGIKGFASLLRRDLTENPDGLALLGRISEGIDALERIVEGLLEAGRYTKLRLHRTDIIQEIRRVIEVFEMAVRGEGRQIEFELIAPEEPIFWRVDSVRIRQVLTNLLRNASDAVGDTGKITVRAYVTGGKSGARPLPGHPEQSRHYLCVEVIDTGPGIPEEMLEKIFSPFFTTKRDGTGVGLSTVRRIVALHGGDVRYSQAESGGSRFIVELPRK
jgi:two-component system nitrogen regulation sensor histidine kinase GlnL